MYGQREDKVIFNRTCLMMQSISLLEGLSK